MKKTIHHKSIQTEQKIIINGKEYASLDEVPAVIRKFIDADGDGVIDALQGKTIPTSQETISIDGKAYNSWDDVPKEFQHLKKELPSADITSEDVTQTASQNLPHLPTGPSQISSFIKGIILIVAIGALAYQAYQFFH